MFCFVFWCCHHYMAVKTSKAEYVHTEKEWDKNLSPILWQAIRMKLENECKSNNETKNQTFFGNTNETNKKTTKVNISINMMRQVGKKSWRFMISWYIGMYDKIDKQIIIINIGIDLIMVLFLHVLADFDYSCFSTSSVRIFSFSSIIPVIIICTHT